MVAAVALDLDGLGVRAEKLWRNFTSIVALDEGAVQNLDEDVKPNDYRLGAIAAACCIMATAGESGSG